MGIWKKWWAYLRKSRKNLTLKTLSFDPLIVSIWVTGTGYLHFNYNVLRKFLIAFLIFIYLFNLSFFCTISYILRIWNYEKLSIKLHDIPTPSFKVQSGKAYLHSKASAASRHGGFNLLMSSSHRFCVICSFNQPPELSCEMLNHTRPRPCKYFRHTWPL